MSAEEFAQGNETTLGASAVAPALVGTSKEGDRGGIEVQNAPKHLGWD